MINAVSTPSSERPPVAAREGTGGPSLFDELGGEAALRAIIDDFVDAIFDDIMIGFLFRNASRERIKAKEYEFAAAHLGGPVAYTGRPLTDAHARHLIQGGQFMRRLQILKETLKAHGAPERVTEHFIAHTESLRSQITPDRGSACGPDRTRTERGPG